MFRKCCAVMISIFSHSLMADEHTSWNIQGVFHTQWKTLSQEVYFEKGITRNGAVFGDVYRDQETEEALAGIATTLGHIQFGIGGGVSRYENASHPVVVSFMWYGNDTYTTYIETEYYFGENDTPLWYRGYAYRRIGATPFFAGIYSEKGAGVGPVVGWSISEHIKVSAAIPLIIAKESGCIFQMELSF